MVLYESSERLRIGSLLVPVPIDYRQQFLSKEKTRTGHEKHGATRAHLSVSTLSSLAEQALPRVVLENRLSTAARLAHCILHKVEQQHEHHEGVKVPIYRSTIKLALFKKDAERTRERERERERLQSHFCFCYCYAPPNMSCSGSCAFPPCW